MMEKKDQLALLCEVNDEGTPTLRAPRWDRQGIGLFVRWGLTCWVIWRRQAELVDLCPKGQSLPTPNDKLTPFWDSWSSNMQKKTPDGTVSISGHQSRNDSPAWTPVIPDGVWKMRVFSHTSTGQFRRARKRLLLKKSDAKTIQINTNISASLQRLLCKSGLQTTCESLSKASLKRIKTPFILPFKAVLR